MAQVGVQIPRDRFVAANGSDSNPGTVGAPWLTLAKVNAASLAPGAIVYFRGGDTFFGQLTNGSSGTSAAPIVYKSYGTGGRAILSGGMAVSTWTQVDVPNNIWRASFAASVGRPRALWVDNKRVMRSRTTSVGTISNNSTGWDSTLLASAAFPTEVEAHTPMAFWTENKVQVTAATGTTIAINSGVKSLLDSTNSVWGVAGGSTVPNEFENIYEVFTGNHTAGTFFQDRTNNFLYMVPPTGVSDPNDATVIAGINENVVALTSVSDVVLSGLQISHTTCLAPYSTFNYIDVQTGGMAGSDFSPNAGGTGIWNATLTTINAAVSLNTCTRVKLSGCLVYQTQGIGVEVVGGSSACELDGTIISDTGGANLQLGTQGFSYNRNQLTEPTQLPQPTGTSVHDSVLQFCGLDFRSHPNVIGWNYDAAYIGYNLVHDSRYSNLALGFNFGFFQAGFTGGDLIEYNEVYNGGVSQRLTDGGNIYLNGINETEREVRFNYFHDMIGKTGTPAGVANIYYDGGALNNDAHDNVAVNGQDWVWNVNTDDNGSPKDIPRGSTRNTLIDTTANSSSTRVDIGGVNTLNGPTVLSTGAAQAAGVALGTGPRAAYAGVRTEAASLVR